MRSWRPTRTGILVGTAAVLILLLSATLYMRGLDQWFIEDDEEGYFYAAWQVSEGSVPYRDFLTPQLPAFLYPGGAVVAAVGRDPVALRQWSVFLTLAAGVFVFLAGRRLAGSGAGLAAMAFYLIHEDVFTVGRVFRPEPTMLLAIAAGIYFLIRGDQSGDRRDQGVDPGDPSPGQGDHSRGRWAYAVASVCFGIGLLAKLFAALPWAAGVAHLATAGLFESEAETRTLRQRVFDVAALLLPGLTVVAGVMAVVWTSSPEVYQAVLGHHLQQGAELTRAEVVAKTLGFYWSSLERDTALWIFVPAGIFGLWRLVGSRAGIVAWQVPTLVAFLLLSRRLFHRHLVYLIPAQALIFTGFLAWLFREIADGGGTDQPPQETDQPGDGRARFAALLAVGTVFGSIVGPQVFDVLDVSRQREVGTERLAALIQALTPPGSLLVADYPGVGFFAGRETTRLAAGLSEGATESGQITGAMLIEEIDANDVALVLVDESTQGGHLRNLLDYDAFIDSLNESYDRLGHFWRHYQYHGVFVRRDLPLYDVDYGWARLVAARPVETTVPNTGRMSDASGGSAAMLPGLPSRGSASGQPAEPSSTIAPRLVDLDLVFVVEQSTETRYTAFVHLVGPRGDVWANGDALPENGLQRATEEWQEGEVVAVRLSVPVPVGAPPGEYTLRVGLYDKATGERLTFPTADGPADAYPAASIEVTAPPLSEQRSQSLQPWSWSESRESRESLESAGSAEGPTESAGSAARSTGSGESGARSTESAESAEMLLTPASASSVADTTGLRPGATGPSSPLLSLLDVAAPNAGSAGLKIDTEWLWLSHGASPRPWTLRVEAVDASDVIVGVADVDPGDRDWPTTAWPAGTLARLRVPLVIRPEAQGVVRLRAKWLSAAQDAPVEPVEPLEPVEPVEPVMSVEPVASVEPVMSVEGPLVDVRGLETPLESPPADAAPIGAEVGSAQLAAVRLPDETRPGESTTITLFWRAGESMSDSYTVLMHAVTTEGIFVAGSDGPPAGGRRPTTSWRPGEIVEDERSITIPSEVAASEIVFLTGLYDARDPELSRLPVTIDGELVPDGRVSLGVVTVAR